MFNLNRLNVIGHVSENPQIYFVDNNKRVATLVLHTLLARSDKKQPCTYNVFIENPDIVEYVDTFVSSGDMLYVEGFLEPIVARSIDHPNRALENWVSLSTDQGFLLLVHSNSQTLKKKEALVDLN